MKSPHANRAELEALSQVPQAPFPMTPSAAALKQAQGMQLAALNKRLGLEDEDKLQATDAPQDGAVAQDGLTQDAAGAEGAALEAIAPAPLPGGSFGLDTLLAQAGPAATAGGGAAGGVSTGAVLGVAGALVILGAAAGGGGDAAPPAPAAPPNKPATINTSEVQVRGYVHQDGSHFGDGDYLMPGNTAATAIKIVDPDGGADLKFRQPTAEELQGKYGSFKFDINTGIWSYEVNPDDPDWHNLPYYGTTGQNIERLTVYSADGTASATIEVYVQPNYQQDGGTIVEGRTAFIEFDVPDDFYVNNQGTYNGSATFFSDGGFALFTANTFDGDVLGASQNFYGYSNSALNAGYDQGQVTFTILSDAEVAPNLVPTFDGSWIVNLTEGEYGVLSNNSDFRDSDNDGGTYTFVLDGPMNSDGGFMLDTVAGITVIGNGKTQVAIQGTLDAINRYIDGGHIKMMFTGEYDNDNQTSGYLLDDAGRLASGGNFNFSASTYTTVNDDPDLYVSANGMRFFKGPSIGDQTVQDAYLPANGDPNASDSGYRLDNLFNIGVGDEEWGDGAYLMLTVAVSSGSLTLDSQFFDSYDVQIWNGTAWVDDATGEYASSYTDASSLQLRSTNYQLEYFGYYTHYNAPESFGTGATSSVLLTLEDEDGGSTSKSVTLHASAQNQVPFFSMDASAPFKSLTIVDANTENSESSPDGTYKETYATATLSEDKHISFKGLAINDSDGTGASKVAVSFYAYEYEYDTTEDLNGIYDENGTVGYFYLDDAYKHLLVDSGEQYVLYGSIDEINAMLSAGGLHYAPEPDYDAVHQQGEYSLGFSLSVQDVGNGGGYGSAYSRLYIAVDMVGQDDPLFILGEAKQYTGAEAGDTVTLNQMLRSQYVFDAEANGNGGRAGNEQELTVTSVTVMDGTGTVAKVDGSWVYTLGAEDLYGDHVKFSYVVSNGLTSLTNTLDLTIENNT
jgi:VCBS repeat-containing protein